MVGEIAEIELPMHRAPGAGSTPSIKDWARGIERSRRGDAEVGEDGRRMSIFSVKYVITWPPRAAQVANDQGYARRRNLDFPNRKWSPSISPWSEVWIIKVSS